jgi:hypothetical protein
MKLPLDAKISLVEKMVDDYHFYAENGLNCPRTQMFKIASVEEDEMVECSARLAALQAMQPRQLTKQAFDTRRIDQEHERNPRKNLQYYHRAEEFITTDDNERLNRFAKLHGITKEIRKDFGSEPEWFESYARQLDNHLTRILRIEQADLDIFQPQLNYLEQLVYARYRLTIEDLKKLGKEDIRAKILSKDEPLMKRGEYIKSTGGKSIDGEKQMVIDGNGGSSTQESIINAIFGADKGSLRKDGDRTVERTITITIRDSVID